MSNPIPDTQADAEEVLQVESTNVARIAPVPVVIDGPVETRRLPGKSGYIRAIPLPINAPPELILSADPRRYRAQLVARGGVVRLGSTPEQFSNGYYFELVNGALSVEITHTGDVWAAAIAADVSVGVIAEYWTD